MAASIGDFRAIMRGYLKLCDGDRFAAIRLFESRHQLPNNYVMKVDKASMSVSVEARVPFLDRRIAEIAYRTPAALLVAEGTEKVLLRRMAERYELLPAETLARRKLGGSMAASWMDDQAAGAAMRRRSFWIPVAGRRSLDWRRRCRPISWKTAPVTAFRTRSASSGIWPGAC